MCHVEATQYKFEYYLFNLFLYSWTMRTFYILENENVVPGKKQE